MMRAALLLLITSPAAGEVGCYTGDGEDYRGTATTTVGGRNCQAWTSTTPHNHGFDDEAWASTSSNYCRNPDGEPGPWCVADARTPRLLSLAPSLRFIPPLALASDDHFDVGPAGVVVVVLVLVVVGRSCSRSSRSSFWL